MRFWNFLMILTIMFFVAAGCSKNKVMTLEDYAKIESEMDYVDPDIDTDRTKAVTAKYGYTFDQYKEFYDKVQKDPELREKLGEGTLKKQKASDK